MIVSIVGAIFAPEIVIWVWLRLVALVIGITLLADNHWVAAWRESSVDRPGAHSD